MIERSQRARSPGSVCGGVVTLKFFALRLAPGDPVEQLLALPRDPNSSPRQRHALGLDRSIPSVTPPWVTRFVRDDWGIKYAKGRPDARRPSDAWPATVRLVASPSLLTTCSASAVRRRAGARSGSRTDTTLS